MANKTKHIIAAILNGVVAIFSVFVITSLFVLPDFALSDVSQEHIFFLFSMILITIGGLIGLVSPIICIITRKDNARIVSLLKSVSTVSSLILALYETIAICVAGEFDTLLNYGFIFWIVAMALINIVSYCVFEPSYKKSPWYGAISGVLYVVFSAAALLPFWDIKQSFAIVAASDLAIYLTMALIVVLSVFLGVIFVAINNNISKVLTIILPPEEAEEEAVSTTTNVSFTASEELVEGPSDEPAEEKKADEQIEIVVDLEDSEEAEEIEERKQAANDKKNNYNDRPRIYHISKQPTSGKWQVKLATGKKAIKLFKTQAEAIAYAKSVIGKQGGSIRIHSLKGKLRKEH